MYVGVLGMQVTRTDDRLANYFFFNWVVDQDGILNAFLVLMHMSTLEIQQLCAHKKKVYFIS